MRCAALACALAGCGSSSSVADAITCGAGTVLEGTTCVAAGTQYTVQVAPQLGADGTTRNAVFVFGTRPDGSPADDVVVLNTDRAGAGAFRRPQLQLGTMAAHTEFVPCDESVPGCLGPVALTLALASAPTVPIAHADTELVPALAVDPARLCLGGGNIVHLEGNDAFLNGTLDITDATVTPVAFPEEVRLTIAATDTAQGTWNLVFSDSRYGGFPLAPNIYEHAQLWLPVQSLMEPFRPALMVSNGNATCTTISGRFVVEAYSGGNTFHELTAAFEQHCDAGATALRGCVHWVQ